MFKKKEIVKDSLEERLDVISDLTRDLDRKEFNLLLDAVKSMFDVRQKLNKLETVNDKEKDEVIELMEVDNETTQ